MKLENFQTFSLIAVALALLLISGTQEIQMKQFPQYRWNPNLGDIKREFQTQKTVEYMQNQGLPKAAADYNPDNFVVLPSNTEFPKNDSIYKNDPEPYYPRPKATPMKQNENVIAPEPRLPIYKGTPAYYAPLPIQPPKAPAGIEVEVQYADLWMNTPTQENLAKLKKELARLREKKDNSVYYYAGTEDLENQIRFFKEKINAMEYGLNNTNRTEEEVLNDFYVGSGLKNVSIVNNISQKHYYDEDKNELEEADGIRAILGEKYVDDGTMLGVHPPDVPDPAENPQPENPQPAPPASNDNQENRIISRAFRVNPQERKNKTISAEKVEVPEHRNETQASRVLNNTLIKSQKANETLTKKE